MGGKTKIERLEMELFHHFLQEFFTCFSHLFGNLFGIKVKGFHSYFTFLKDVFLSNPADSMCSSFVLESTMTGSFIFRR